MPGAEDTIGERASPPHRKEKHTVKKTQTVIIVALVIAAIVLAGLLIWRMNVARGQIALANRYDGQFNVVETTLFKMRTTIKNIHTCNTEWADKFIAVVAEQSKGRPGRSAGGAGLAGALAGGVDVGVTRESEALGIPSDLYMKLANAIEGQLADFARQQNVLTDIWQSHKTYCEDPWHNILGLDMIAHVKPKPEMITSAETKSAVASKQMDESLM